jgi:hypothetical protein
LMDRGPSSGVPACTTMALAMLEAPVFPDRLGSR